MRSNENSEDRKRKKLSKRTEDRNKGDMKEITPHFHLFLFIYFFCTFKFNHHLEGTVKEFSDCVSGTFLQSSLTAQGS